MATKPLQSVTFPNLPNQYTIPVVDSTLSKAGAAADAKKTGDEITDLKADLSEIFQWVDAGLIWEKATSSGNRYDMKLGAVNGQFKLIIASGLWASVQGFEASDYSGTVAYQSNQYTNEAFFELNSESTNLYYRVRLGHNTSDISSQDRANSILYKRTNVLTSEIEKNAENIATINEEILSGTKLDIIDLTKHSHGYYSRFTGIITSYESTEYAEQIHVNAGDIIYISGRYGSAVCLIAAFKNGIFSQTDSVFDANATHEVIDYAYTVPEGVTTIGLSSYTNGSVQLSAKTTMPLYAGEAAEIIHDFFNSKIGDGRWKNKKIVWFGTSIPEGGYPQIVGNLLGATVYNEAVGTSRVHFKYPITPTEENPYCFGTGFKAAARTLTNTLEEQEWIIDNYNSSFWTADAPSEMTEELASEIRSYSYEEKLDKYLTDETFPDLFVFDHGHNDRTGTLEIQNQYYSQYGEYNLYTFRGAMNFLINRILTHNPKARIVMIGEYTGTDADFIPNMQLQVARDWNIPICKNWERLGWTKTKSITVNAHWVKRGSYYYWEADTESHTYTIFDSWVPDGVHPIFDGSGRANNFMAYSIAKWLCEEVTIL